MTEAMALSHPESTQLPRWAYQRAGTARFNLEARSHKPQGRENGTARPTLNQVRAFVRVVHAPVGCLFLTELSDESNSVQDLRVFKGRPTVRTRPNL